MYFLAVIKFYSVCPPPKISQDKKEGRERILLLPIIGWTQKKTEWTIVSLVIKIKPNQVQKILFLYDIFLNCRKTLKPNEDRTVRVSGQSSRGLQWSNVMFDERSAIW